MAMSTRSKTGATAPAPVRPTITKKRDNNTAATKRSVAAAAGAKVLPDVTLLCDDGQPRRILSLLTDETPGMILFTYPRANTPGCTTQACGLSSFAADAAAAGYVVVGASYDSVKSQASWKAKHSMAARLVCDTLDVGLLKKLGVHKAPKSVKRSVFIIRRGGLNAEGTDPLIVESRITISPKDSIEFVEKYVKDHPCAPGAKVEQAKPAALMVEEKPSETPAEPEPKVDTPVKKDLPMKDDVKEASAPAPALAPTPVPATDEKIQDKPAGVSEVPKAEGDKQ